MLEFTSGPFGLRIWWEKLPYNRASAGNHMTNDDHGAAMEATIEKLLMSNAELRRKLELLYNWRNVKFAEMATTNAKLRRELDVVQRDHAISDPETGLRNRRYFDDRLREELSRAGRSPGSSLSLLTVGCRADAARDGSIRGAVDLIRQNLREHDVCCRLSDDELGVILPKVDGPSCQRVVSRLRESVEDERAVGIELTFGSATWPTDAEGPAELVAMAEGGADALQPRLLSS